MKAKLTEWINSLSGSMSKNYYAVPCTHEPGWCIIRHKPGPRNTRGKSKKWIMPETQATHVRTLVSNQAQASAIYHDPAQRALYEQEYQKWLRNQSRHGKPTGNYHGKMVRWLWDYIRIRVAEENTNRLS